MKLIIVGNWKNYPNSLDEANTLLSTLSKKSSVYKNSKISTVIAPPLVYLETVSKKARRFATVASQNLFYPKNGTYTGEVTVDVLKSFGVKLSILGHSEQRKLGETSETVSEKVRLALKSTITPLVCVGEEEHDAEGNYFEILRSQIATSLQGVKKSEADKIMIAYEPVWAIGSQSNGAMSPEELTQMVIFIKKVLTELFSRSVADKIPVLYGGSVDAYNAKSLVGKTGARGLLIGRASINAKSFFEIVSSLVK